MRPLEERFWEKVDVRGPDECWIWTGAVTVAKNAAYGKIGIKGKTVPAHRVAYMLRIGPIPDGMEIDHLCFVSGCVNPAHLEAVTPEENKRRCLARRGIDPVTGRFLPVPEEMKPQRTRTGYGGI